MLNGGLASYTQWVTLFEYDDDDEFDGSMGTNDLDEEPRILINFHITQQSASVSKQKNNVSRQSSEMSDSKSAKMARAGSPR